MFRRAMRLLGDEAAAAQLAEDLFVRLVVHAGGERMDARARWAWIYRVVTAACLRQLPPGPPAERLGLGAEADRLDEATRATIVFRDFDGLDPAEIGEVLGPAGTRILTETAATGVTPPASSSSSSWTLGSHPSSLALDRDPGSQASHVQTCTNCQTKVAEGARLSDHFARALAPLARERVIAAIRSERARKPHGPRWRRLLWMTAAAVVVAGLALLVARPRRPARVDTPYADLKGASRAKKAGLQIVVRRGEEVRNLDPMAALRGGDRLHFRVRADRPRYLEVRVRGPAGDVRVFPETGTAAVLVRPRQSLDRDYLVAAPPSRPAATRAPSRLWIVALFADRPFALDRPPEPDIETVPVRVDLE
jgi:hypothetical protein